LVQFNFHKGFDSLNDLIDPALLPDHLGGQLSLSKFEDHSILKRLWTKEEFYKKSNVYALQCNIIYLPQKLPIPIFELILCSIAEISYWTQ